MQSDYQRKTLNIELGLNTELVGSWVFEKLSVKIFIEAESASPCTLAASAKFSKSASPSALAAVEAASAQASQPLHYLPVQ